MSQVVKGKCSHCSEDCTHTLDRRSFWSRNIYTCQGCDKRTVRCRLCDGMAKVAPQWADEFCSDHWSSDDCWAPGELACISRWAELWEADPPRWKQMLWKLSPYRGDAIESFDIRRLSAGDAQAPRVICINGFLGQSDETFGDWSGALQALFPDCPAYGVRWESRRGQSTGEVLQLVGAEAYLAFQTYGASAIWGWQHTVLKAQDTGRMLASVLMRTRGQQFILCGHSLGARVVYYALAELAKQQRNDVVVSAHLMGGAVGCEDEAGWSEASRVCSRGITNYYSRNDDVLQWLYKPAMGLLSEPIGRNRVKGLRNVDVSAQVAGHNEYKPAFSKFAIYPVGL
jgi:pimeloyl-ACP methyl ester carboxylesterase